MADPTQISEALRAARELLAAGWCQGHFARDNTDYPVHYTDSAAVSYCLLGACALVVLGEHSDYDQNHPLIKEIGIALRQATKLHVIDWNDTPGRTQAEVLAAVDATIARLETK